MNIPKALQNAIAMFIAITLSHLSIYAQNDWDATTVAGNNLNTPVRNNIFGTAGFPNPVGKRDIRFFTFGAERMRLIGEPGFNQGFLGINTIAPQSVLNVSAFGFLTGNVFETDGSSVATNTWRMFTGLTSATATEKFNLFNPANSNNIFLQSTRGDMFFNTAGLAPFFITQERMHITNGTGNQIGAQQPNATRINISYGAGYPAIANPIALLNLGFDPPTAPNGGQRTWMDVGTFTCANSDNMYVGLKNEAPNLFGPNSGNDKMDAVINWGDNNAVPTANGPDNMRFIFTQFQNPATTNGAASTNGLEVMRMTPQGSGNNTTVIFTGIGGDPALNTYTTGVNPGNTLEVNSVGATNVIGGSSGLRFTNLNTTSPTLANPGAGVLAVNANGDVIYVPAGGQSSPFFGCGGGNVLANLPSSSEFNLNNFNFIFHDNGLQAQPATVNNVGIGLQPNNCAPIARLEVQQSSGATGGTKGIVVSNTDPSSSPVSGSSIGIKAILPLTTDFNRIAGWFQTPQLPGTSATAIYVPNLGGKVTIGFSGLNNTGALLEVNGDIFANNLLTPSMNYPSDAQLKTNIQSYNNGLNVIRQIQTVTFNYNGLAYTSSDKTHIGVIAQGIQLIPQIATYAVDTFQVKLNPSDSILTDVLSINTESFLWTAINAIKELDSVIIQQNNRIDSLENQLNSCCSSNARTQNPSTNQTDVTLSNSESIVLNQNTPNPFAEQTTITYNLPQSVQKAQLLFYDANGKLIKAVDLNERGKGQINVFANDLSNGIYSYALVVDGQIIDTKRMVKTN
jgi:hypothetical protein